MTQINWLDYLLSKRFDHNTQISQEQTILSINDAKIGTQGNIVALVGLPKSGKSLFLSAFIASFLTDAEDHIFNIKLHKAPGKNLLAWFDTEQSNGDIDKCVGYIMRMSGIKQKRTIFRSVETFALNGEPERKILQALKEYLKATPACAVLILDGLLDVVSNMNDEINTKKLVLYLKKLAIEYNILLITALHLGKKDGFSIGHIGSEIDRRAQSVLKITKDIKTAGNERPIYCLEPVFLRSAPYMENIEIQYNERQKTFIKL